MGIGNVTTEQVVYDEKGKLVNDGTWEYKPPCSKTIPLVSLSLRSILHSMALVPMLYSCYNSAYKGHKIASTLCIQRA